MVALFFLTKLASDVLTNSRSLRCPVGVGLALTASTPTILRMCLFWPCPVIPSESLRWKLCREMSCLGGADLHHLLSDMFCEGLAKRCFSCWAASISPSSNFSLEVSDASSSTRLKMHSVGEANASEANVCYTACFSSFLWKNTISYVTISLIICESLNVSCTDLVKRCLSCWLGGWVGPNYITSQPTFLTNDFQTLHLSYCYISSASSIYIWRTVTMHLLLVLVWVHSRHLPSKAEFLLE